MTNDFLKVLGLTIRDQIIMKNSVEIKGLGTFKAEHTSQQQERKGDGKLVMLPPKDSIEFKADMGE
ncbi:MAG: HU family DNA-binding protein [Balneola sp.]